MRLNKPFFQINSRFFPLGVHEQGHNCDLYKALKNSFLSEITVYKVVKIVEDLFDVITFVLPQKDEKNYGNLLVLFEFFQGLGSLVWARDFIINKVKDFDVIKEKEKNEVQAREHVINGNIDLYIIDFLYLNMSKLVDENSIIHSNEILRYLWLNGDSREIRDKIGGTSGDSK